MKVYLTPVKWSTEFNRASRIYWITWIKLNRTPQYHLPELRGGQIFAEKHR